MQSRAGVGQGLRKTLKQTAHGFIHRVDFLSQNQTGWGSEGVLPSGLVHYLQYSLHGEDKSPSLWTSLSLFFHLDGWIRVQYRSRSLLFTWWMATGSFPRMLLWPYVTHQLSSTITSFKSALLHESYPQAHFTDENTKLNRGFATCP